MKPLFKQISALILLLAILSCDVNSNCGSNNVDYITFRFLELNANQEENNVAIVFDSVKSENSDSIFFNQNDTISAFKLPLNPIIDTTNFIFYSPGRTDSIQFTYEKYNSVDSPECGINNEFVGLDTVYQTFDSLVIVNDTLRRTVNAPNIKLFIL